MAEVIITVDCKEHAPLPQAHCVYLVHFELNDEKRIAPGVFEGKYFHLKNDHKDGETPNILHPEDDEVLGWMRFSDRRMRGD